MESIHRGAVNLAIDSRLLRSRFCDHHVRVCVSVSTNQKVVLETCLLVWTTILHILLCIMHPRIKWATKTKGDRRPSGLLRCCSAIKTPILTRFAVLVFYVICSTFQEHNAFNVFINVFMSSPTTVWLKINRKSAIHMTQLNQFTTFTNYFW